MTVGPNNRKTFSNLSLPTYQVGDIINVLTGNTQQQSSLTIQNTASIGSQVSVGANLSVTSATTTYAPLAP